MIRMIQSQSADHAKDYFTGALMKADYYLDDQELNGVFQGRLSKRLGIGGPATREAFFALCENRHPQTGLPLTPRTKKDRTVGYDINFHVPKSVSVLHALVNDGHVLEAFQRSVAATMQEIEADARVRVRKAGQSTDRVSGELLWVDFVHQTARPVDGFVPDPHLHAHCYVFNLTWDETETRVKACQFRQINKDMPYYQAMFHKRLADNLVALGYQVRRTAKSFEIDGIPQEVIDLFSKRTDEIGRVAKEKGITDAKELSELGARTRSKKQTGLTMEELKAEWKSQIRLLGGQETKDAVIRDGRGQKHPGRYATADKCIDYALSHCFERASVVPRRKLIETAMRYSIGSSVSLQEIATGFEQCKALIHVKEGENLLCTTVEVLAEEQRMVQLANAGRNRFTPLYAEAPEIKATGQQRDAIAHVLTTSDMVSIVRGAAGAGKTTLMKEAISLIGKAGKQVVTVAPTARASRGVLREEGFTKAETVALLLLDEKKQEALKGQVLWVDEAGMLGTKDMASLLDLVTRQKARIILGGDTRQHASVVRGDALRILNTVGGIRTAEVDKIYRQKDVMYRRAVADLSKGDISGGFDKLDQIGAIRPLGGQGHDVLIDDYMAAKKAGKDVLMISPTHDEGEKITAALRLRLRKDGFLGKKEIAALRLKSLGLTEAEKTDWRHYEADQVVQFLQNQKGIKRGQMCRVIMAKPDAVTITNKEGKMMPLNLDKPGQFEVYRPMEIALAKGDQVQITKNGFDRNKHRLDNGMVLDVSAVSKAGGMTLTNPVSGMEYKIADDFGHISHAHCITSHASQGRTVDAIFVVQPAATFGATNAKQFYVSVSRAREQVNIYTDEKEDLLYYASQIGDRQSALELVRSSHDQHLQQVVMEVQKAKEVDYTRDKLPQGPNQSLTYDDYEPGI